MGSLDALDWALVGELQRDARTSFNELARRVHLSAPAVAERVRRLEASGVITGYHATIDLAAAGWSVLALVRMNCYGPNCVLRDPSVAQWPSVLEIHRVTGDECCIIKVAAESMPDFERVIDALSAHGRPSSTLILSSPLSHSSVARPSQP